MFYTQGGIAYLRCRTCRCFVQVQVKVKVQVHVRVQIQVDVHLADRTLLPNTPSRYCITMPAVCSVAPSWTLVGLCQFSRNFQIPAPKLCFF